MHSLAIALRQSGHTVTGSDDRIYDPARSRLAENGILPSSDGWDPARITPDLDAVILGMHAFEDNPELLRAQELNLNIYSFPEFIYEQSRNKQRIVIAGSYGKTSITAMIMHVLKAAGKDFDYLIGAQVPGFDNSVRITHDAPCIVLEGDEYLASRMDPRPKFLLYQPHIAVVTGISWDHINVYPTEEEYIDQFDSLIQSLPKAGVLIYNESDELLRGIANFHTVKEYHYMEPYSTPYYRVRGGTFYVRLEDKTQAVSLIGRHNMENIAAAWKVCQRLAVDLKEFLRHISTFEGAKLRLEKLQEREDLLVYRDYAHAPVKVQATVEAVRERYKDRNLVACLELHTFSSLDKAFLKHYRDSLKEASVRIVFVDGETVRKKRMDPITEADVKAAFGTDDLIFTTDPAEIDHQIRHSLKGKDILLMMSSGNFGGLALKEF
jgi:UDP-N-acetylmuramate: L-alanyl-gamma-D-glutamyl-meso-diaminopimelate ligase